MIAKVRATSRITRAVMYGQDERKGGEVLLFRHIDMTATPEEQAADLIAMSKPSRRSSPRWKNEARTSPTVPSWLLGMATLIMSIST